MPKENNSMPEKNSDTIENEAEIVQCKICAGTGNCMTISKEEKNLNMPWEKEYGYSQAVKVGDTIYLSGQISHDETGKIVGVGDVEAQIRQAYVNIKKLLAEYGASVENIVDETWFVTDITSADAAGGRLRKEIYSGVPVAALTVVQIQRLAFPELLIEIKCVAKV